MPGYLHDLYSAEMVVDLIATSYSVTRRSCPEKPRDPADSWPRIVGAVATQVAMVLVALWVPMALPFRYAVTD